MKASTIVCGLHARTAIGLIIALQAGCASTQGPARHRAPSMAVDASAPSGLSLIWRNTDLRPVAQPIAIGDAVVGIVAEDHKAFVVGIDPATGRMLWHDAITHSTIARGERIHVTRVGDDKVAYLRMIHKDSALAYLVVADARTGRELARSPMGAFPSGPIVCANRKDVCAISTHMYTPSRQYRLDVSSGAYIAENNVLPRTRFLDGAGLLDAGDRPGNSLALIRNGAVAWLTRISAAFPSGYSTDHGWHWHFYAEPHVFVGTVGRSGTTSGNYYVIDRGQSVMAGLSERTGKVIWRDSGSHFDCNLPSSEYAVRCRTRGEVWVRRANGTLHLADLDVTIEGFDPATGRTTWSLPMGPAEDLEDHTNYPAIAGPGQVVVSGRNGPMLLDYAAGTLRALERGATFWCMSQATYEVAPPYRRSTADWSFTRTGGKLAWICDVAKLPATRLPSIEATMAVGVRVSNVAVIATADGYLGFKAP